MTLRDELASWGRRARPIESSCTDACILTAGYEQEAGGLPSLRCCERWPIGRWLMQGQGAENISSALARAKRCLT